MNLRTVPRAVVGGSIKLLRVPIRGAVKLTGRNGTTGDRLDATVRDVAGTVLADRELKAEAARRRTAADERDNAARLRAQAQQRTAEADEQLNRQTEQAEARKREASEHAEQRKRDTDKEREQKQRMAAEAEGKRKETARTVSALTEEVIDERAKRERLEQLDREAEALDQKEGALTAADEAQRLRDAAGQAKAARKQD